MKHALLTFVMILFLSAPVHAVENPWTRKLPFKEAVVTYEISGTMQGKETVYVKDHGRTTAAYHTESGSSFGVPMNSRELTLTTPEWVYTVDLGDNTGTRQINPKKVIEEEFGRLSRKEQKKLVKNSDKMGITMVGDMSGSVEKKAVKLKGYACDKVTALGIETFTLAGTDFPMKVSGSIMGMQIHEEVTRIEKKRVPTEKFALLRGADIRHEPAADAVIRNQIHMMFQSLLAGERPVSRQEQSMDDMGEAMETFRQMQENGGFEALQNQMQGLFGPSGQGE
ncbi:hypothetical protein [Desulfoluna spongiiphila]|uniref:hypothetical protein n=1 Tax=Desulfoluna spongiiphila TaxID=419481 RepID=UPI00125485FF|nr:hypothetical protein [Desulfoluna spongiiphila]VVS95125.1 hypothetical protein DBB_47020 [Desulfoluna spongiiphila]